MADRTGIAITVVIALIVAGMGGYSFLHFDAAEMQNEMAENRQHFEAFCTDVYGEDADVYRASDSVAAEHNGLHCEGDEGMIHLTQVPPDIWEQYKAGEVSAGYVQQELRSPPGIIPDSFLISLAVAAPIVLVGNLWTRYSNSHKEEVA